jgi:hypothetical protein
MHFKAVEIAMYWDLTAVLFSTSTSTAVVACLQLLRNA